MIVVSNGSQVVDMVAVRLFLFPHSPVTLEISPLARSWAIRRGISIAYNRRGDFISLPEEYEQYRNWARVIFLNSAVQDGFETSIELLMDTGWTSIRGKIIPFDTDEREWIWDNLRDQYYTLTRRKPKS